MKPSTLLKIGFCRGANVATNPNPKKRKEIDPKEVKVNFRGLIKYQGERKRLYFDVVGAIYYSIPLSKFEREEYKKSMNYDPDVRMPYSSLAKKYMSSLLNKARDMGPYNMGYVENGEVRGRLNNHLISLSEWSDCTDYDVIISTMEKVEEELGVK